MRSHNLCFGAKIRKKVYFCIPQFCYIKLGFNGVYIKRTCFCDGTCRSVCRKKNMHISRQRVQFLSGAQGLYEPSHEKIKQAFGVFQ